jgi:tetratricopeptide (TPR) repeat protein
MADVLIQRLSSMPGFTVRSLSAIRGYRGPSQDPIAAGHEQQVDYVISSSYQLTDGKIRIGFKVVNVASGETEQSYNFEKGTSDLFAMQDAIALEIGNKLQTQFAAGASVRATKRGTSNQEAYRLYLQGMYLANNRNLDDAREAVEVLTQAVSLDPNYARAWAGLGYAHRTLSLYRSSLSTHETYQKSMAAINEALSLDANLSEAHSALCENKYLYEWDFAGAELECKRAIELDPSSSQAHEIYSRFLMGRGRHQEAILEIETAIDLEPASRFNQRNYGRALFYARRYAEAAAQFERVLAMDENFVGTYSWLTSTLALQGKEAEAFEWLKKLLSYRKVDEKTVQVFTKAFQSSGWRGVLSEYVERIDQIGGTRFDRAMYNAQLGNKDKAFEQLEEVYRRREIWMTYLRVEPRLDSLRNDSRFSDLLRRVESK